MDAMNTSTASQEDREYDADMAEYDKRESAKKHELPSVVLADPRKTLARALVCVPNLQNLLPVQLTTQLSVAMAAHAHTEDPGPFPSRHPGCRVHALGCYLVLCQCSHRRLRRLVITRLAPQLAGQSPPRAPRARRRLRSPTETRLSGSRRVALPP